MSKGTLIVGCTLTTYSVLDPDRDYLWKSWLTHGRDLEDAGYDIQYFCAIETDARGMTPFAPLLARLAEVGGEYWSYVLDDGRDKVTGENRGRHICAGLNLVAEYATAAGAEYWLRVESDTQAPVDAIPKLLEVRNGLAAAACSTYFRYDDPQHWYPQKQYPFPVVQGPMTAACLLMERKVFKRLKWRWDLEQGMTDDPAYTHDAATMLGVPTYTRLDCVAKHHPPAIGPIDTRFPGLDMEVRR